MEKINYLIAAASHRSKRPATEFSVAGKDILKLHLKKLSETDVSMLSQVTLLRISKEGYSDPCTDEYWDVQVELDSIGCPYEVVDIKHECMSYGAWIRAVEMFGTSFDYYILIEDDYYPELRGFVKVLLDLHKNILPGGGYLSGLAANGWAAISNGIIDSKSFLEALDVVGDPVKFVTTNPQINFSYLFAPKIDDYTDYYRSLFLRYTNTVLWEECHDINTKVSKDIFNPIEFIVQDGKVFQKNRWDKIVWDKKLMDGINKTLIGE